MVARERGDYLESGRLDREQRPESVHGEGQENIQGQSILGRGHSKWNPAWLIKKGQGSECWLGPSERKGVR